VETVQRVVAVLVPVQSYCGYYSRRFAFESRFALVPDLNVSTILSAEWSHYLQVGFWIQRIRSFPRL